MAQQVPLVDYLVLDSEPHLVAYECMPCGARYFDFAVIAQACFGTDFRTVDIATGGTVETFTIVAMAAPGIPRPSCRRSSTAPAPCARQPHQRRADPDHVSTGMKVRLATYSLGADDNGVEAIGFWFEPAA